MGSDAVKEMSTRFSDLVLNGSEGSVTLFRPEGPDDGIQITFDFDAEPYSFGTFEDPPSGGTCDVYDSKPELTSKEKSDLENLVYKKLDKDSGDDILDLDYPPDD